MSKLEIGVKVRQSSELGTRSSDQTQRIRTKARAAGCQNGDLFGEKRNGRVEEKGSYFRERAKVKIRSSSKKIRKEGREHPS